MESVRDIIDGFVYDHVRKFADMVDEGGEDTVFMGVRVLDDRDKFTHGALCEACLRLYVHYLQEGKNNDAEHVLAFIYKLLDIIKRNPCYTWGKIAILRGLLYVKDKGFIDKIDREYIEVLKEKTDYSDFFDLKEMKLIGGKPSNYVQVAMACAGMRERLGWDEGEASEKIKDCLFGIIKGFSSSGYMDEDPPHGRFDRYSLILTSELCDNLARIGKTPPDFVLENLKSAACSTLFMANRRGDGTCYGRSLSVHGDLGCGEVLASALRLGLIEEKDKDLAVKYILAGIKKTINFWYNREIGAFDIWYNGRSTNSYRQTHRVLEVNIDVALHLFGTLDNLTAAGLDRYVPKNEIAEPDKWVCSEICFSDKEGDRRSTFVLKREDKMIMLPLVGQGKNKHSPYLPFPASCRALEAPPECEEPFLTPLAVIGGKKLIPKQFYDHIEFDVSDDRVEINARGALATFDTFYPERSDVPFDVKYVFDGRKITVSYSFGAEAEDCEMMFCMHEEKVGLKAFGFSEESVSDELCNPAYFCPHGRTERVYRFSGGKGSKFGYELYI